MDLVFVSGIYVIAWKHNISVISAGDVKVYPDPRFSLVRGYNLQISGVSSKDAGDYVCQIGTMEPQEITHTLEVLGECKFFVGML